jgi:hypothetical protein
MRLSEMRVRRSELDRLLLNLEDAASSARVDDGGRYLEWFCMNDPEYTELWEERESLKHEIGRLESSVRSTHNAH